MSVLSIDSCACLLTGTCKYSHINLNVMYFERMMLNDQCEHDCTCNSMGHFKMVMTTSGRSSTSLYHFNACVKCVPLNLSILTKY